MFHLKVVLIDEEKEEILRDIILNDNSCVVSINFIFDCLIDLDIIFNKYINRIEEYRKEQLEKDFNKIKNR